MKDRRQNELLPASNPSGRYALDPVVQRAAKPQKEVNKLQQYAMLLWAAQIRWWKVTLPLGIFLACAAGLHNRGGATH